MMNSEYRLLQNFRQLNILAGINFGVNFSEKIIEPLFYSGDSLKVNEIARRNFLQPLYSTAENFVKDGS